MNNEKGEKNELVYVTWFLIVIWLTIGVSTAGDFYQ